ncbi:MAG: L-threonylcarbamoyladenylate synthase [Pseudanabaenaceae cyanobacterium bins.68]|nr:L-threonylcarbamoyladenylate synthase [Pseudanabaenaceae cyanobacterium bins.68]
MVLVDQWFLVERAKQGEVVCFPTDTVPALAVLPHKADLIYQLKGRDRAKPLILMAATWQQLQDYLESGINCQEIVDTYFPGALTLVLPANHLGRSLNLDHSSLGVRVPNHQVALAILAATGPMLTTSANLSGQLPLRSAVEIDQTFRQIAVLEESEDWTGSGLASTVVAKQESGWQILRQGAVVFRLNL